MNERFWVVCPYCGETCEIYVEADVEGRMVQDCEVCCNPWELDVWTDGETRGVEVSRADGLD